MTRSRLLARIASVVLLLHAWALVVPIVHEAEDLSRSVAAAERGPAVSASCDPGCRVPGHEHRGHDPATCASCRALDGMGAAAQASPIAPPPALAHAAFDAVPSAAARGALGRPASRGPPSLLA